ncbi:MAG TPA: hypothetical protein VHR47_05060, partial [Bacillota bacterium]|nr:hypothetical protein [Bacillota bacterium]
MTPSQYIKEAWHIMQKDFGVFFGGILLLFLIIGAGVVVPFGNIILEGPAMVGIMLVSLRAIRQEPYEFGDIFKGFEYFGESVIASFLIFLVSLAGVLCCIIPAFFLAPFLFYPFAFIIDKKMTGMDAFKASWELVKKDYGRHFVLYLLIILLNLLGLLLCCVGVLFTSAIGTIA